MNKKKWITVRDISLVVLVLIITILMGSPVHAATYDNVKSFDSSTSKYGTVTISNWFGVGGKLAEYTLLENTDECLINCYAVGSVILYEDDILFSKVDFYNKIGTNKGLKSYSIYVLENYEEEKPIYENKCDKVTDKNGSVNNECSITKTGTEKIEKQRWIPYNNEILKEGTYTWKIEGTKEPTVAIDWIPTTMGKEINEWAWWNTNWAYYKELTITPNAAGGAGSYVINKTTINLTIDTSTLVGESKLQADCDDLRVVYKDSIELDRVLGNYDFLMDDGCNSASTNIFFMTQQNITSANTDYKIYYGNNAATNPPNKADRTFLIYENCSDVSDWYNFASDGSIALKTDGTECYINNLENSRSYKSFFDNNSLTLVTAFKMSYRVRGSADYWFFKITSSTAQYPTDAIQEDRDFTGDTYTVNIRYGSTDHAIKVKTSVADTNQLFGVKRYKGGNYDGWINNGLLVWNTNNTDDNTLTQLANKLTYHSNSNAAVRYMDNLTVILEPDVLPALALGSEVDNNQAPIIPLKDINSTEPIKNTTNYDVKGWFNCSDVDVGDTLKYDLYWLKDNVTSLSYIGLSVTSGDVNEITLAKDNLTEGDLWSYQINCSDGKKENWTNSTQIEILANMPVLNSVWINSSSPTTNYTINDIYAYFTCDDDIETALTYDISWLKNNVSTITYTGLAYTNGTIKQSTLHNGNTSVEDLWNAQIRCSNSLHSSAWQNTTQILIENRPPTQPTVQLPTANYVVSNETTKLKCNGSTDADGHSINYEIYTSTVNPPTTLKQNTTAETYDNTYSLQDKTAWYIRCRANDGIDNSTYSDVRTYYVNNRYSYNGTMGYEPTTTEGKLEYFNITFTFNKLRVSDVEAKLIYDGALSTAATKTKIVDNSEIGEYRFVVGMYMPSVTTDTAKTGIWNLTMTLNNGSSMLNNTFTFSQTVLNSNIFLCGNATTNATQLFAYNFTFWDEANNTRFNKNATFKGNFQVYVNNQSLNTTILVDNSTVNLLALGEIDICLTPVNATFGVNADIEYYAEEYDKRGYYMRGSVMKQSLAPDSVKLYLLHEDLDDGVTIYVQDSGAVGIPNALVKIQRYYPELDQYLLVAMAKTNTWGVDYTYLRKNDVFYRFVVVQNGAITFTSSPTKVTGDIVTLTVAQTTVEEQTQAFEDVAYTLVWNNASKRAVVTWDAPTDKTLCLKCIKVTPTGNSQVKDECSTTSSGTLYCFLNESYEYQAIFYGSGDINMIIEVLNVMNKGWDNIADKIGLEGVGYTLLISGTLAAIGVAMGSLVFAIAGAIIGLIMMTALGLVKITYAMLIGITVVAVIAIIRVIKR